jgi:hypothetical protein
VIPLGAESPQGVVTRRRYAAGSWVSGEYAPGASTDTTIAASVQPLDGDDLQSLDEGDRARRSRKLYTTADLRTALQSGASGDAENLPADQVVIDTVVYEVRHLEVQGGIPAIAHRKALVVALREVEP